MRLWISEGFIQPIGKLTLEDIAEDNLQKLIDRSLVQAGRSRADGGVKTCRIHDLLREFCISESKKEKFLETEIRVNSSKPKESNRRRISLHCSAPCLILSNSCDFSHIRMGFQPHFSHRFLLCFLDELKVPVCEELAIFLNSLAEEQAKPLNIFIHSQQEQRTIRV